MNGARRAAGPQPEHKAAPLRPAGGEESNGRVNGARRAAGLAAALAVLLAGCGIRSTTVPVDAGAAPARSACTLSDGDLPDAIRDPRPAGPTDTLLVEWKVVYLVCNGQVDRVVREGRITGTRVEVAGQLLDELGRTTRTDERRAGYETSVPVPVKVMGPREGDPRGTLRLGVELDALPPFALGQIVCTLSYALADRGPVELAGPEGGPVREYSCNTRIRTEPDAGPEAGTPV